MAVTVDRGILKEAGKVRTIPQTLRRIIDHDPLFEVCIHINDPCHRCDSRITVEHALIHAGKQINEIFSLVPCCRKTNNDATGAVKAFNRYVALYRLYRWDESYRLEMFRMYPKINFDQLYKFLKGRFYIHDRVLGLKLMEEEVYLYKLGVLGCENGGIETL